MQTHRALMLIIYTVCLALVWQAMDFARWAFTEGGYLHQAGVIVGIAVAAVGAYTSCQKVVFDFDQEVKS